MAGSSLPQRGCGLVGLLLPWAATLSDEGTSETRRARATVERILANIEKDLSLLPPETERVWNSLIERLKWLNVRIAKVKTKRQERLWPQYFIL